MSAFRRDSSPTLDRSKAPPTMFRNGEQFNKIHHMPLMGQAFVEVSHVETPSCFWTRPYNHITNQLILEEPSSAKLRPLQYGSLAELKNRYCMGPLESRTRQDDGGNEVPQRRYGRARIIRLDDHLRRALIIYIDQGVMEWVPPECLAIMPPEFYYHPWQVIYCSLGGVYPVNDMFAADRYWTMEQVECFREIVREFSYFRVSLIRSTKAHHDYAVPYIVELAGFNELKEADSDVDMATLFATRCVETVEQNALFNSYMAEEISPPRDQNMPYRVASFPENWETELVDEGGMEMASDDQYKKWEYDPAIKEFQIPHIDLAYLKKNGYFNADGTVNCQVMGCYVQGPYEFYGIPLRRREVVVGEADDEPGNTISMREATIINLTERKNLAELLDAFYKVKSNRIQIVPNTLDVWLRSGKPVYAIVSCSGMERRKKHGTYQRAEIISKDSHDTYRVRFLDAGGILPQVHHTEVFQISAKHCSIYAMSMQLCWHGVRDHDPKKKDFSPDCIKAFKNEFYTDGPIKLRLIDTPRREKDINNTNILPYAMWNVMYCSHIFLDPSLTKEVDLRKVLQYNNRPMPGRLATSPTAPLPLELSQA
ncbi:unnamed protein product, partial [Mesorhabditis spiculigera]